MTVLNHEADNSHIPVNDSQFVVGHELRSERVMIDVNERLGIEDDSLNRVLGESALTIAGIRAGKDDEFLLLDTRRTERVYSPLLLVNGNNPDQYKGVWPHTRLDIGRAHNPNRFEYSRYTSTNHFSLYFTDPNKGVVLRDNGSKNGTFLTGYVHENGRSLLRPKRFKASYTEFMNQEMQEDTGFGEKDPEAPYGYYNNHPIIGRESRSMRNGAYGSRGSEQIIIDDKSRQVRNIVNDQVARLTQMGESSTTGERALLKDVMVGVSEALRYDLPATEKLCEPHYGNKGMIMLSEFLDKGIGVCRHQAVLAALIMESAIENGLLYGQVSVERNQDIVARSGHAWAVFKSEYGDIIVDSAQHFVGSREEAAKMNRWHYNVSDES